MYVHIQMQLVRSEHSGKQTTVAQLLLTAISPKYTSSRPVSFFLSFSFTLFSGLPILLKEKKKKLKEEQL